jgi:hypothetical protein
MSKNRSGAWAVHRQRIVKIRWLCMTQGPSSVKIEFPQFHRCLPTRFTKLLFQEIDDFEIFYESHADVYSILLYTMLTYNAG